jgi:hypothetical protein
MRSDILSNQDLGSVKSEENEDKKYDSAVQYKNKILNKRASNNDSLLEFIEQNNDIISSSRHSCQMVNRTPNEYFSQPSGVKEERSFDLVNNLQEQIDLLNSKLQQSQK